MKNIERAILSTMIFHDISLDEAEKKYNFKLQERYFLSPLHKQIVKIIKQLQKQENPFDENIIKYYLEKNKIFNEQDYLEILITTPLIFSSLEFYYELLQRQSINNIARLAV